MTRGASFLLVGALALLAGCQRPEPWGSPPTESVGDAETAQQVLVSFFDLLHSGDYAAAADLYGGTYEVMRDHNPLIDPNDQAALLQAACEINGAQCLPVADARYRDDSKPEDGLFLFETSFLNDDGSLFVLGPCCGDDTTRGPYPSSFTIAVQKQAGQGFLVMDPPIYGP